MATPATKVNIAYSGLGTNIGDTILVNYNLAFGVPEFATTEVVEQSAPETPLTHVIETEGFLRVTQNGSTPASGTFVFTITVPSDEFVRSILNGNIFKEETLKDLFTQLMLLTGEVREGRLGTFQQDLDMGSFNIVNMADGVDPQDAVTKNQLDAGIGATEGFRDEAEVFRDEAAVSAAAALASELAAAASALAAATSETNAAAHEQGALDALAAAGLPASVVGQAGKSLFVNQTETGYEFKKAVNGWETYDGSFNGGITAVSTANEYGAQLSSVKLDNVRSLIACRDGLDAQTVTAAIVTRSGETLSAGSWQTVVDSTDSGSSTIGQDWIELMFLDTNKAVLTFGMSSGANIGYWAVVLDISGDTITPATPVQITTGWDASSPLTLHKLATDEFLVSYVATNVAYARGVTVSGSTLTMQTEFGINALGFNHQDGRISIGGLRTESGVFYGRFLGRDDTDSVMIQRIFAYNLTTHTFGGAGESVRDVAPAITVDDTRNDFVYPIREDMFGLMTISTLAIDQFQQGGVFNATFDNYYTTSGNNVDRRQLTRLGSGNSSAATLFSGVRVGSSDYLILFGDFGQQGSHAVHVYKNLMYPQNVGTYVYGRGDLSTGDLANGNTRESVLVEQDDNHVVLFFEDAGTVYGQVLYNGDA